jgi:sterol desaturase/sphingolipid hydroxylase (fatty acid hydroxylase superfamily)
MVIVGVALWTLVEYAMHRVIYHHVTVFKRYHEAHHASPQAYVGAPPVVGTGLVFLFSFTPLVAFAPDLANGLTVGMLCGYAVYMSVHHACHFWTPTPAGYLYRIRLHHAVHHYRDDGGNFGVTSSVWDRVFGTRVARAVDHSPVI